MILLSYQGKPHAFVMLPKSSDDSKISEKHITAAENFIDAAVIFKSILLP